VDSAAQSEKAYFMSIAPFVQTPLEVARKMLELSQVKRGETLYDLGCGDGRLIILAAKEMGATTIGVELREDLIERAKTEIKRLNLEDRVKIVQGNFFDVDISNADVVTLYLTSSANERLRPKLEAEMKQGSRVISHDFKVPGWKPSAVYDELLGHTIYTYKIGEQL
jgi:protein-L-isoaspartate O-methyltransferase